MLEQRGEHMQKEEKPKGLLGPAIFAALALGALYLVFQLPETPSPEPRAMTQEETNIAVARRACRDLIGQQLHDPSSAQWGNVSTWKAGLDAQDNSRILVQPEIRATNAFGATILTRFQCTFW